ncbi:MAG: TonB-dependent receptor plug domain-containing protein [Dysgonamonadaceae bacterium]|jgi:hypothetical protein|nr:TonB-dependent receptor plug domain-containing protein [Dysgonamonadaceae bacterium]
MHQLFNKNKRLLSFLLLWMAILSGTGRLAAQENLSDTISVQKAAVEENPLGAVSTIYTDQLSKTLATTIIPSLTGRLPGLDIYQYRGIKAHAITSNTNWDLAGSLPDFSIGKYSDNTQFSISSRGASPLVMIDGVQCELFSLDPEAVESVSLQKDALSSLQQGMRSARGLLVITTKQPDAGGFQLSFTGKYGMQQAVNLPKPLPAYQYAYLLNEALQNDGKNPVYSAADFNAFRNHTDPFANPDVNWYDQTMKNHAAIQSYNLNASGGGKTAQYFVSLGYMNEEGLFRTSSANSYNTNLNYERYLITSKINVNVTEQFKVNLSLIGRIEDENQPGATADDILYFTYLTPNNAYPVRNPNGSYGGNISFPNNTWAKTVNSGYISDNARNALATINLKYDMGKWIRGLSAQADGSVFTESRSALIRNKQATTYQYKPGENGNEPTYDPFGVTVSQSNDFVSVSNYQYMYGQVGLNYERTVKQHALEARLLADVQQATFNYNLPDRPANVYGKLKYNYSRKYFAEAAINRSYYNGYAPGKQWGTFYAFGLGWDLAKENFLSNAKYLDQ